MILHGYWRSSASWRVRIALAYKGLSYEYRAVNLVRDGGEQYGDAYRRLNPLSQVPVLELSPEPGAADGRRIAQSMAILEYLEECHPQPPLLPAEPWSRARARQLAELVNAGIQPLQNAPAVVGYVRDVLHGDEKAWLRHFIGRGLTALELTAQETAGAFLVGDAPTFADVCLVPQLYAARRFAVPVDAFSTLLRAEAACNALPAFAGAHPDLQPDAPPRL